MGGYFIRDYNFILDNLGKWDINHLLENDFKKQKLVKLEERNSFVREDKIVLAEVWGTLCWEKVIFFKSPSRLY